MRIFFFWKKTAQQFERRTYTVYLFHIIAQNTVYLIHIIAQKVTFLMPLNLNASILVFAILIGAFILFSPHQREICSDTSWDTDVAFIEKCSDTTVFTDVAERDDEPVGLQGAGAGVLPVRGLSHQQPWHRLRQAPGREPSGKSSVSYPDPPDPHVFGPPESRSISQRYGFGSAIILLSSSKNIKKNLDSYSFVTSSGLFIFEK